jgi:vancomycin resistance protein YoaR
MAKKNTTKLKVLAAPADAAPAKKGKAAKPAKAKPEVDAKPKKLSAIDAAAKVLADAGTAMNCQEMIEAMAAKKLWTSPGGKTPAATLYSAILRECATKGKDARFTKTERGKFAAKA